MAKPKLKIVWTVAEPSTGRYRSFSKRGWPSAWYEHAEGEACAAVYCETEYVPADVKSGNHPELILRVADHSVTPWEWRQLKKRFATMREVKEELPKFLERHPSFVPKKEGSDG